MKHLAWLLLVAVGCGSSDADVEGAWTIAVTNRDNGCNFANWTDGNQASGIPVQIDQEGSAVNATITGGTGAYLSLVLGSNVFTGDVSGDDLALTLFGTNSATSGNCTYTYNAELSGTVTDDTMTGRIDYTAKGNGNPDCAAIDGCVTFQEFNGTRPPT